MGIWLPVEPPCSPRRYAEAWPYGRRMYECFELGYDTHGRPEKFPLEWQPDSDVIGDFVWPAGNSWIVTRREIGEALRARWPSVELGPVDYWQEPKLYELKRKPKKPRVLLPYTGPELVYLRPTVRMEFDRERSRFKPFTASNGQEFVSPVGVETRVYSPVANAGKPGYAQVPREPGGGFYFPEAAVKETGLFRTVGVQCPDINMTDAVKTFIESQGWSNIEFWEQGETF